MGQQERKERRARRRRQLFEYVTHVVSLSLSVALAQMWVGFMLRHGAGALASVGLGKPTEDFRAMAAVTVLFVLLMLVFEDIELHTIAGGIAASPYV